MKKFMSLFLAAVLLFSFAPISAHGASDYVIDSPYAEVVWSGENAWGAYKGNLHTHSTLSDGEMDFKDMVLEHYRQGFDFLAMTEHGITGKAWNEKPTRLPLYLYQNIIGRKVTHLTDDEFKAVTEGSYPVDGAARGRGMTCVAGGNELNALTATKCHVNGMFLPEHVGDNYLGYENDHEGAVRLTDKAGGISFINHPGDWLTGNKLEAVSLPENVKYFSDILLKYDSCLGMEVFNEKNAANPYDRVLFDNVLMNCLPYGKRVIAFSNNDAHYQSHVDTSFSTFMMRENNVENIKATMISGAFFCTARRVPAHAELGPAQDIDARDSGLPYPEFREVSVDGHKVTVRAVNAYNIQWVANGKVIASKDIEQSGEETAWVLDLDEIEGVEDFLYIRCQLLGSGGCTLTQALLIDRGTQPLKYEVDNSTSAKLKRLWFRICSLRLFVIVKVIIDKIK